MQENNREFSVLKQRILQFAEKECISKYDIYSKTGISNGVFSQKNGMSEDNILKFLSYYSELNPDWLLTGKGTMLKTSVDIPIAIAHKTADAGIPLVDISAVGGFGNTNFAIQETDVKDRYVVPKFKDKKVDFLIEVAGSSMYPKYNSGDVVACTIIRESQFVQWGKVHVIGTIEQGILIKRLYECTPKSKDCIECRSDNKNYPAFQIHHKEITGVALVVGVIRLE